MYFCFGFNANADLRLYFNTGTLHLAAAASTVADIDIEGFQFCSVPTTRFH